MKIRVVIADDEPLARERLLRFLAPETDVDVVAVCGDGAETIRAIEAFEPDLVFLDVQMPEVDGFGVAGALPGDRWPLLIFVTAYDEFAVRAFEVHALDYLLKPFDRERLRTALERARRQLEERQSGGMKERLRSMLDELQEERDRRETSKHVDRLAVKTDGRVILLRTDEIDWIEAADNYVSFHLGEHQHLHRETMASLESRLDPERFLRVSRSAMVNVERIREFQPLFHGDYVILLHNGTRLTLSRNYRDRFSHLLGKLKD